MKYGALLVAFAIGCAAPQAPARSSLSYPFTRRVSLAAPTTLEPTPWQVGQWAYYTRFRGDGTRLGGSRISVVAADSCGLWFEIAIRDEATLWTWMFCMHRRPPLTTPQLQVVIKRRNDEEPELIDFRRDPRLRATYQWLLDQITPRWVGRNGLPRENVRVYAGTFDQTLKTTTGDATRWSHPLVPFDGRVKYRSNDLGEELTAFGDSGESGEVAKLALDLIATRDRNESRSFLRLGLGSGWFKGVGDTTSFDTSVQWGFRLTRGLAIVLDSVFASGSRGPVGKTYDENTELVMGAVEWTPLQLIGADSRANLYLRVGVGFAEISRYADEELDETFGVGFGASVGISATLGRDWRMFLEVDDQVSRLGGGEGTRHHLGMIVGLQLDLPRWLGRVR